jgi:signal transduction histidine kinase
MRLKDRFFLFVTSGKFSGIGDYVTFDGVIRLMIVNIAYTIGSILIIFFGVTEIQVDRNTMGWLFLIIGFLIFVNLWLLRTELPFLAGASIVTVLYGFFCILMIIDNAASTNRWIYTLPLMSIFTLGFPLGLIPALAFFGLSLNILITWHSYTISMLMQVSGVYLFILLLAIVYEKVRQLKDKWGRQLTEELKMESVKAQEAQKKAEESSFAKSEFLSRMSHEMRTPMNAVIGMTAIAQSSSSSGDTEKTRYCLDKINEASVHLLGVINDILDMSKIEAGKFEISPTRFDIEKMLDRVIQMIQFRANEKKQRLVVRKSPDLPRFVIADDQRLAQVITNLLTNAVKFTPEQGSVILAVEVSTEYAGAFCTLKVSVIDTGIGISEEQRARLFSRFEQADGSIARKYGGTGLGLAISKSILELMGGRIWVESEKGKGSSFFFEIKVAIDDTVSADADSEGAVSAHKPVDPDQTEDNAGEALPDAGVFAGQRILLAEDVAINREIILALLEDTGVIIDCVENGAQAVKLFSENADKYRLIFMDMQMPEMDGLEASRRIRALESKAAKTVPIIAMTANVFSEDIERCLNAGMDDHIGKPIDFDDLMKKLKKYLL